MSNSRSWIENPVAEVNAQAGTAALDRQSRLTKPAGALGDLEQIAVTLAGHQGRECPRIEKPEIFVFAADHGVAAQGVSAYPQSVTAQMVHNFLGGGAAVSVLAKLHGARLTVVDTGVIGFQAPPCGLADDSQCVEVDSQFVQADSPCDEADSQRRADDPMTRSPAFLSRSCNPAGTRDFTLEPAMTNAELEQALSAGRECVEMALARGCDVFIAGEMGIGNTTAASALACALLGKPASELVGLGTGISDQTRLHKCAVVDKALALHAGMFSSPQNASNDPGDTASQTSAHTACASRAECVVVLRPEQALDVLRRLGGFEIAAMAGAALACAQSGLTFLVDGFIVSVAALVAASVQPAARDWMLFAHQSAEAGHNAVLSALDAQALLKLNMRLGEGSGAALALPLLKAACQLHGGMATFEGAGVSTRSPGVA